MLVQVVLPYHLRSLAQVGAEVRLTVGVPPTQRSLLDALEAGYPVLRGTIRDPATGRRRPHLRFFADGQDLSHDDAGTPLPSAVTAGREPFVVVGAIAGG